MKDPAEEIKGKMGIAKIYFVSIFFNSILLCFWVAIQYCILLVVKTFPVDYINSLVLLVFRILFAIGTLSPIIIRLITDIRIMMIQANKEITEALQYEESRNEG